MPHTLPKLVAFDIDQTLTDTKTPIDDAMAGLVSRLAERTSIAIVSGAPLSQSLTQVVHLLALTPAAHAHIFIIPTNGAALYTYSSTDGTWRPVYELLLTDEEKHTIHDAFVMALSIVGFSQEAPEGFGPLIEDRGSQITYSALGANAPAEIKKQWDPDFSKRKILVAALMPALKGFSIKMGGTTSIDITREGINKAFGLFNLIQHLSLHAEDVLYIGDALFSGGNDASLAKLGVQTLSVGNPGLDDTKDALRGLLELPE
jgi:hypothetical protein